MGMGLGMGLGMGMRSDRFKGVSAHGVLRVGVEGEPRQLGLAHDLVRVRLALRCRLRVGVRARVRLGARVGVWVGRLGLGLGCGLGVPLAHLLLAHGFVLILR